MNDSVHPARYLRKHDSALLGMFHSHPGPIAQLRCGELQLYYLGLPTIKRHTDPELPQLAAEIVRDSTSNTADNENNDNSAGDEVKARSERDREHAEQARELVLLPRVAIWTMAVQSMPPPAALLETLDGLVVAGMGTGSLSQVFVEQLQLRPGVTGRQPPVVVIVSRAAVGLNFDDFLYKGSVAKYEALGFALRDGYAQLNALQARILLLLRLLGFSV